MAETTTLSQELNLSNAYVDEQIAGLEAQFPGAEMVDATFAEDIDAINATVGPEEREQLQEVMACKCGHPNDAMAAFQ